METKTKIPAVLSGTNFEALLGWMRSDSQEAPEFADEFMVTLDLMYMTRSGRSIGRGRGTSGAAARLSLSYISENPLPPKNTNPSATRKESIDAIQRPEPPKTPAPLPKIGDNTIPFTDENGFLEAGKDSLDIAKAIAWHYTDAGVSATRGRPISMAFLQKTLYVVYGTFLAQRLTRLTAERPQMWKFGPIFPRVYSKMSKGIVADAAVAQAIREQDPSLDEFIGRIVRINAEKTTKELDKTHKAPTSPWGRCLQEHPDKWGTVIDDRTIAAWFQKDLEKARQKEKR